MGEPQESTQEQQKQDFWGRKSHPVKTKMIHDLCSRLQYKTYQEREGKKKKSVKSKRYKIYVCRSQYEVYQASEGNMHLAQSSYIHHQRRQRTSS
jgi:hypothetical protein